MYTVYRSVIICSQASYSWFSLEGDIVFITVEGMCSCFQRRALGRHHYKEMAFLNIPIWGIAIQRRYVSASVLWNIGTFERSSCYCVDKHLFWVTPKGCMEA